MQLIDGNQWFQSLRKNLGKKNCELGDEHIQKVIDTFLRFEENEQSKLFPNKAFGYWKVVVERPLRLNGIEASRAYSPAEIRKLKESHERSDAGTPVIKKIHKHGKMLANPLHGFFGMNLGGKMCIVEYEPDSELRDTESIPLLEQGGIAAFIAREVLPHVPDAWVHDDKSEIGYEISFTRYFYKPKSMRSLDEIRRDIEALEQETEGLLDEVLVEVES